MCSVEFAGSKRLNLCGVLQLKLKSAPHVKFSSKSVWNVNPGRSNLCGLSKFSSSNNQIRTSVCPSFCPSSQSVHIPRPKRLNPLHSASPELISFGCTESINSLSNRINGALHLIVHITQNVSITAQHNPNVNALTTKTQQDYASKNKSNQSLQAHQFM